MPPEACALTGAFYDMWRPLTARVATGGCRDASEKIPAPNGKTQTAPWSFNEHRHCRKTLALRLKSLVERGGRELSFAGLQKSREDRSQWSEPASGAYKSQARILRRGQVLSRHLGRNAFPGTLVSEEGARSTGVCECVRVCVCTHLRHVPQTASPRFCGFELPDRGAWSHMEPLPSQISPQANRAKMSSSSRGPSRTPNPPPLQPPGQGTGSGSWRRSSAFTALKNSRAAILERWLALRNVFPQMVEGGHVIVMLHM